MTFGRTFLLTRRPGKIKCFGVLGGSRIIPGSVFFAFLGFTTALGKNGFVWFFPGFAALRAGSWDHFDIFLESSGCLDYNGTHKPDFGGMIHEENIDNCYAALDDREPDGLRQPAKRCP